MRAKQNKKPPQTTERKNIRKQKKRANIAIDDGPWTMNHGFIFFFGFESCK